MLLRLKLAYPFLLFIRIEYGLRVENEARYSRLFSFIISVSSLSWSHDNLELNTQTANAGYVVHLGTNMVWNGEQQRPLDDSFSRGLRAVLVVCGLKKPVWTLSIVSTTSN